MLIKRNKKKIEKKKIKFSQKKRDRGISKDYNEKKYVLNNTDGDFCTDITEEKK